MMKTYFQNVLVIFIGYLLLSLAWNHMVHSSIFYEEVWAYLFKSLFVALLLALLNKAPIKKAK